MKALRVIIPLYILIVMLSIVYATTGYAQGEAEEKPQPLKLDGTEWGIDMYPVNVPEGVEREQLKDIILFRSMKFKTQQLEKQGFNPSNYTLSVKHDGTTICETMQSEEKNTVFWRLEMLEEGRVRGVASIHEADGTVRDYRIGGRLWSGSLGERVVKKQPPESAMAQDTSGKTGKAKAGQKGKAGALAKKSLWQRILDFFRRKR